MTNRAEGSEVLTAKQRLCIFNGTDVSAEQALGMEHEAITFSLLRQYRVTAENLIVAGIGPRKLKSMGMKTMDNMRDMGFDALHLADSKFASECVTAFGSQCVIDTFLCNASDAVSIAGTEAVAMLGLTTERLLSICAGAPLEARAVLEQLSLGVSLSGVSCKTLLDSGIRKQALAELGYSLAAIATQTSADAASLQKLGFS